MYNKVEIKNDLLFKKGEVAMKKIFKCFILSTMLVLSSIPISKAFFLGRDVYTANEYKEANIVWKRNILFADEYCFNGDSITQTLAEQLTTLYRSTFKKEGANGGKDTAMYNLYIIVAQFTLNTAKEVLAEATNWRTGYYGLMSKNKSLELENSRLKSLLRNHKIVY